MFWNLFCPLKTERWIYYAARPHHRDGGASRDHCHNVSRKRAQTRKSEDAEMQEKELVLGADDANIVQRYRVKSREVEMVAQW